MVPLDGTKRATIKIKTEVFNSDHAEFESIYVTTKKKMNYF